MSEELQQGTDDWKKARCGKVTASKISDMLAKTQNGWGASRANYAAQLIAERLTRVPAETYVNATMQWGIDTEPKARQDYAFREGNEVQQVGFIDHPRIANSGASPDGLVGKEGLIEIKCPSTATHLDTLLGKPIDNKYILQMQWQMACTGRQWCDFESYDPRLPYELQIKVIRVQRDNVLLVQLEKDVRDFVAEIDAKVAKLESIIKQKAAA